MYIYIYIYIYVNGWPPCVVWSRLLGDSCPFILYIHPCVPKSYTVTNRRSNRNDDGTTNSNSRKLDRTEVVDAS